jgi:hypothetical protein
MLKLLTALIFSLSPSLWALTISDQPQPQTPWKIISQTKEEVHNSYDFFQLQKKYPQFFDGYEHKKVTWAYVTTYQVQFLGKTICKPQDPRLLKQTYAYGLCEDEPDKKLGMCFESDESIPPDDDPCLSTN